MVSMETVAKTKLKAFVQQIRVRYSEVDQLGIAYYAHYLVWLEVARVEYLRYLGIAYGELEKKGVKLPVRSCSITYLVPVRYDDLLNIHTVLTKIGRTSITFEYEIIHDKTHEKLTTAETTLVCVDSDLRPVRLPKILTQYFPASASPKV